MALVTGCQQTQQAAASNTPSSPTAPAGVFLAPAAPAAPAPLANATGEFDITFAADASCQLPAALRSRTYVATIDATYASSVAVKLSGADFYPLYETFSLIPLSGTARFVVWSMHAMRLWHEQSPIYERLPGGGFLAISGFADAWIDASTSSVSTTLDGTFQYCPTAPEWGHADFPHSCPNVSRCAATGLKLVRR